MNRAPLVILIALVLLASCKTRQVTEYVTVEVPRVHTEWKTDTLRDSVHVKDSVTVYTKGDTVFVDRTRNKVRWRDRIVRAETCDTVTVVKEVPVPVEVEKKLSKWQKVRMRLGDSAMALLALAAAFIVTRFIWRYRRRT